MFLQKDPQLRTSCLRMWKERWRYLQKLDANHKLLSLEGFTDSEGNVIDFIVDEAVDVAETVVHAVMVDHYSTWKNWESG